MRASSVRESSVQQISGRTGDLMEESVRWPGLSPEQLQAPSAQALGDQNDDTDGLDHHLDVLLEEELLQIGTPGGRTPSKKVKKFDKFEHLIYDNIIQQKLGLEVENHDDRPPGPRPFQAIGIPAEEKPKRR